MVRQIKKNARQLSKKVWKSVDVATQNSVVLAAKVTEPETHKARAQKKAEMPIENNKIEEKEK